jgi:hypothetical protein
MLSSKDIREWIKTKSPKFDKYYVGKLDNKYQKAICVYSKQTPNDVAIGGKTNTKIKKGAFSILIHYDKNYTTTEHYSQLLYDELFDVSKEEVGDYIIDYVDLTYLSPIDLYSDDNGVYERAIDFTVYYHDKNKI